MAQCKNNNPGGQCRVKKHLSPQSQDHNFRLPFNGRRRGAKPVLVVR
jgi:hypothetical protein